MTLANEDQEQGFRIACEVLGDDIRADAELIAAGAALPPTPYPIQSEIREILISLKRRSVQAGVEAAHLGDRLELSTLGHVSRTGAYIVHDDLHIARDEARPFPNLP